MAACPAMYAAMAEYVNITLPPWLSGLVAEQGEGAMALPEERMQWVIGLARMNIEQQTGGPFAAAVFDMRSGRAVAAGVNMVTLSNRSIAHAEMVAMTLAQQAVENFDLGAEGLPEFELVTSTEPCCMCFGAVLWSGVRRLVCGARGEDACRIGFDEGRSLPTGSGSWSGAASVCRPEFAGRQLSPYWRIITGIRASFTTPGGVAPLRREEAPAKSTYKECGFIWLYDAAIFPYTFPP